MINKLKDKKVISAIIILILVIVLIIAGTLLKNNQAYKTDSQNHQQELEEIGKMEEVTEIYLDEGLAENQIPSDDAVYKLSDETIAELKEKAERFWERDQETLQQYIDKGLTKESYIELWKDNAYFLGEKQEDSAVQETIMSILEFMYQ